jgi:hypothetical protein
MPFSYGDLNSLQLLVWVASNEIIGPRMLCTWLKCCYILWKGGRDEAVDIDRIRDLQASSICFSVSRLSLSSLSHFVLSDSLFPNFCFICRRAFTPAAFRDENMSSEVDLSFVWRCDVSYNLFRRKELREMKWQGFGGHCVMRNFIHNSSQTCAPKYS